MDESWADRVLRETRMRGTVDVEDFCALVEQVVALQAEGEAARADVRQLRRWLAETGRCRDWHRWQELLDERAGITR